MGVRFSHILRALHASRDSFIACPLLGLLTSDRATIPGRALYLDQFPEESFITSNAGLSTNSLVEILLERVVV